MCMRVFSVRTAQPTGFGKLAFYARIQRVDAEGVGGGKLIAHSCVEGGCVGPLRFLIRYKV